MWDISRMEVANRKPNAHKLVSRTRWKTGCGSEKEMRWGSWVEQGRHRKRRKTVGGYGQRQHGAEKPVADFANPALGSCIHKTRVGENIETHTGKICDGSHDVCTKETV